MYRVSCPTVGSDVTLSSDAIVSLHKTSSGTTAYFRCTCGAMGVMTVGALELEPSIYHPARTSEREVVTTGAGAVNAA